MAVNPVETSPTFPILEGDPERITHLKPPVDPASITWRDLRRDPFWQKIPAWEDVDEETFLSCKWQERNAITSPKKLVKSVRDLVSSDFNEDVEAGFAAAPMAVRISPYVLALIDWSAAVDAHEVALALQGASHS